MILEITAREAGRTLKCAKEVRITHIARGDLDELIGFAFETLRRMMSKKISEEFLDEPIEHVRGYAVDQKSRFIMQRAMGRWDPALSEDLFEYVDGVAIFRYGDLV
jgi:hypothetical protein